MHLKFDSKDPFLVGHRIVKARSYKRETPDWANNDTFIQKMLLGTFPKLKTDKNQRDSASRWMAVIHFYFRMKYTYAQTAKEIGSSKEKIEFVIRAIYRVVKGLRANGTGKKTGKRGRPKKNVP